MEVMIAIGLLAVAALSLLTVFIGGLRLMQRSNETAAATDVAKATLEAIKRDFRLHGLAAIGSGTYTFDGRIPDEADTSGPSVFPPAPYPSRTIGGQEYILVVEGREEGTRLRRIKVSVYWNENQPLVLETIIHP